MNMKVVKMPQNRGELLKMTGGLPANNEPTEEQRKAAQEWFTPIFQKICGHCPGWKNAIGEGAIGVTAGIWMEALTSRREILNPEALNRGMRNLQEKRLTWLPSPLDFVDMCLQDQGGSIPSMADAKYEIQCGRKVEYVGGKRVEKPYSSPFVEYLAGKTGAILHPSTSREQRDIGFSIEYRAAVELAKTGFFEQGDNKRVAQQPMDSNLAYYFQLVKSHGEEFANEFLADCATRGIHIDPVQQTVTRGASVAVERVVSIRKPAAQEVALTDEEAKIANMVKSDPLRISGIYLAAVNKILEKIGERHELAQALKTYVMANGGEIAA